jgi:double-stranded uracil-DNA glycosylase
MRQQVRARQGSSRDGGQPAASVGFPPVSRPDARLLLLGSLPGQVSLAHQQYYAQPRNAFWGIVGELLGFDPALDYAARQRCLVERGVALWDVCAAAVRPGSLDARIRRDSVVPNDFATFLGAHPQIRCLCFNGVAAASLFGRLVLPVLPPPWQAVPRIRLPSTSPAHAGMRTADKLEAWRAALRAAGVG